MKLGIRQMVFISIPLGTLAAMRPGPCAKRIAVLSDMCELGERSRDYHVELAKTLSTHGIDKVYASGKYMAAMFDALPADLKGGFSNSTLELGQTISKKIRAGDVVTVKGSLASRMKTVVDQLIALQIDAGTKSQSISNGNR